MNATARIIVADDDPDLSMLLRETLVDAGYEVQVANNGDQLVRLAQDQPPDLIVVDLMMPLMDGFEAIRQLRNDTRTSHLPMIILTARNDSAKVVMGFESGADDYITKPYEIDVLLARIRSHLRRAAQLPVRSPLTGLPGNMLIQAEIERQIDQQLPCALIYIDLDNFKAFNDVYGFARGDRAIHLLASVLGEAIGRDDFLGHIGGDDFALLHYGPDPEELCRQIIATFDARVRELYDEADLARGYLIATDRHGIQRQFGILSLSIALVNTRQRHFASLDQISKVVAELKQAAKQIAGSSYVADRRADSGSADQPADRRGSQRPAALIICRDEVLRATLATTLNLRGYSPLIADSEVAAHGLLAHRPDAQLVVADADDEAAWDLWRGLPAGTPLIALVDDEQAATRALGAGASATVLAVRNPVDVSDQLQAALPTVIDL